MKSSISVVSIVAVILATVSPAHSLGYQTLHNFAGGSGDGTEPTGSLTLDSGKLYGMTSTGGASGYGTVFSLDIDGSNFALLHAFAGATDDGKNPYGSLTLDSGKLYGMTASGGASDQGTVFSMDSEGSNFTLLHDFAGGNSDGADPYGSLILESGTLYGMTSSGGDSDLGTVFSMDTDGSDFALLHDFAGGNSDGADPRGSLILDSGRLYGMTYHGGNSGVGTVFSMDTDGTDYSLLREFAGGSDDGQSPYYGSLSLDSGKLYGTTLYGGDSGLGTIFSMNTDGSGFALSHEFAGGNDDGIIPYNSLSLGLGKFYGMTAYGGDSNEGTVFSMDTGGSNFALLYEFTGGSDDGENPHGGLTLDAGRLYGMTGEGGASDKGVIFVVYILPGDVNGDGWVAGEDLSTIIAYWGQSGLGHQYGDLDGNGMVDGPDYSEVISYWGTGTPPEPPSSIPEPGTMGMVLLAGGLLLLGRRQSVEK